MKVRMLFAALLGGALLSAGIGAPASGSAGAALLGALVRGISDRPFSRSRRR
jgi:hypothetical protein